MADETGEPDVLIPMKRPICSQRAFREMVKQAEAKMLRPPWSCVVKFYHVSKGQFPHDADPFVYCCAVTQPQYHKIHLHAALDHNGWLTERTVMECIRHELAHSFFQEIGSIVQEYIDDQKIIAILDRVEDTQVDRIATMPALEDHE